MHAPRTDRSVIVELFAQPRASYTNEEVFVLLGISDEALAVAIATGVIAPEKNNSGALVIPWEDVAHLALEKWTPRMIEAALGDDAAAVIPTLNQHRSIRVLLPHYLIRLLDEVARTDSARHRVPRNASDILERILHDYANTLDRTLTEQIPGFSRALDYPYIPDRSDGTQPGCTYCGTSSTEPRAVCRTCVERHEPDESARLGQLLDGRDPKRT